MTFRDMTASAKVLATVLVLISLGSCAIIQYTDNRSFNYSLEIESGKQRCGAFTRKPHIGHSEPLPPKISAEALSDPEEMTELALSHAENLKKYIVDEQRYLAEDIARHMETCK